MSKQSNFGNKMPGHKWTDDRFGSNNFTSQREKGWFTCQEARWWAETKRHHHRQHRVLEKRELHRLTREPDSEFIPPVVVNDYCW